MPGEATPPPRPEAAPAPQPEAAPPPRTLLLSVDYEDWHQLVRRRAGDPGWSAPGPALARQTEATLALFDELGVRATFFVLGMAARAHPELVRAVADAGHEIACHGDAHRPVHAQSPAEFAADLRQACATIEELTGRRPRGYRAPAFSITSRSPWAFTTLAHEGFTYDSSQHESFAVRDHIAPEQAAPHRLRQADLWEFPVAVWRPGRLRLPVGGASYWTATPIPLVLRGLADAGPFPALYLHPHELDPAPLRPQLSHEVAASQRARAGLRTVRRNAARRRAPEVLRALASQFALIPYGEAHARLSNGVAAGT